MKKRSFISYILCIAFISIVTFFYYPKWENKGTEATISYDVSGYYIYLPAIFIYEDLKQFNFFDEIIQKYRPTHGLEQVYLHPSGNYVAKYSSGQALQYLPFFLLSHSASIFFGYPADGFSYPYQVGIGLGSFLVCLIGLWFLRKVLLEFFDELTSGITLLLIVLATNYLDYAAINGAMTHNFLFTIYAILIWSSNSFYKSPSVSKALLIGILVGWATLTRPTEIISMLIPLGWGISSMNDLKERLTFWRTHFLKLTISGIACIAIGSIQIIYWKYVTGEFWVYSYQDQGFSWFRPHLIEGFFSYHKGWLVYTPVMVFALLGFIPFYKTHKKIVVPFVVFSLIFIYITFAGTYGGMVEA